MKLEDKEELKLLTKELSSKMKKLSSDLVAINNLFNRNYRKSEMGEMLMYKQIEDGILNNLHKANKFQINQIKTGYMKWRYYTQEYVNNYIEVELLRITREKKLKRIERR